MLGIRLTALQQKAMLRLHSRHMLRMVNLRLVRPENSLLLDYFTNEKLIREVLETHSDMLLDLNDRIWTFLKSRHTVDKIDGAMRRTFSEKHFFDKKTPVYNAYHLCQKIGLNTCPYCNITPIPTVVTARPKVLVTRPPLDHFFANKLYPMLAISFFNLVPGCDTCNSRFKLAKPTHHLTHLNPHAGEFADGQVFRLGGFRKIDDVLAGTTKFNIRLKNLASDTRFDGNEKLFWLNAMYGVHKEVAHACLVKSRNYTPAMLKSIEDTAHSSLADGYFFVFGVHFELERLHEHPLSKLKRDIVAKYASDHLKAKLGI